MNFVNAGFLMAGLAVAIPIAIHLLFRQKPRLMEIGTLRFLKIALAEKRNRQKLKKWLLLFLRSMAVALLALLFARPYFAVPGGLGSDQLCIVLMDRSASMQINERFETVRERVQGELEQLSEGTSVQIAALDSSGVVPLELEELGKLEPGFAGSGLREGLKWARDVAWKSGRPSISVWIASDLQTESESIEPPGDFPEGTRFRVFDVGSRLNQNLGIDSIRVPVSDLREGEPLGLETVIHNWGAFTQRNISLRIDVSGPDNVPGGGNKQQLSITSDPINLNGAETVIVPLALDLEQPGKYRITARLQTDDGVEYDNVRYFAFEARDASPILLIDGDPGETPYTDETYYLEMALRLSPPGAKEGSRQISKTPFDPIRVGWRDDWGELPLKGVVVLANVESLTPEQSTSLKQYLEQGGKLLITTGDRMKSSGWSEIEWFPALIEDWSEDLVSSFADWDRMHPLWKPFEDPQQGDLRRIIFRSLSILSPSEQASVLASDREGRPLVIESKIGQGTVMVTSFAADRDWATHPLFVPFFHQAALYLTGRLEKESLIKEALADSATPPGIDTRAANWIVHNVPTSESSLARDSEEQFRAEWKLKDTSDGEAPRKTEAGASRKGELVHWFLVLLFLVLLVEPFLANRTPI